MTFEFDRKIWMKKNWKITRTASSSPEPHFRLDKNSHYSSHTGSPFWRWRNFFLRTFVTFSNLLFYLGVSLLFMQFRFFFKNVKALFFYLKLVFPFVSKVSLRALFSIKPYFPNKKLNSNTV